MQKLTLTLLLLAGLTGIMLAQKEANHWYFGTGAGLDFSSGIRGGFPARWLRRHPTRQRHRLLVGAPERSKRWEKCFLSNTKKATHRYDF
ncbi:MAG: hypothetical protein AAFW73_23485 [Bacteroidota bacterium]